MIYWKTRKLKWEDVRLCDTDHRGKPWHASRGWRVTVSLINCSFVLHTFWIENYELGKPTPAQQAMMLLKLQQKLRKTIHRLRGYSDDTTGSDYEI